MSGENLPVELTRVPRSGLDRLLEWSARHPVVADLTGAAVGTSFLVLILSRDSHGSAVVNGAAVLVVAVALATARRAPFPLLLVVLATQVTMTYFGTSGPMGIPAMLALYPVVVHRGPREASMAVGLAAVATTADATRAHSTLEALNITLSGWVLVLLTVLAGMLVRGRRARLRDADEALAAAARALRLDRERAGLAQRVAVARDLHDSVGHALTSVIALGRGARKVLDLDPEQAGQALDLLVATASAGLEQTREVVGRLQDGGTAGAGDGEDLTALPRLVQTVTTAGVPVTVHEDGTRPDGATSALVFRVVREGLTNVLRHAAGATTARVRLTHTSQETLVQITDDGQVPDDGMGPDAGTGHGLSGLRQQLAGRGGTLTAGPGPIGGWRVQARVPGGAERS